MLVDLSAAKTDAFSNEGNDAKGVGALQRN